MIKVTIASPSVNVIPYTSKKDGSSQSLRLQAAYAHVVDADGHPGLYPEKFEFPLGRDQAPFPPGEYVYHASAFYVRNGRIQLSDSRLSPLKAKAVA